MTFALALGIERERRVQLVRPLVSADRRTIIRAGEHVTVRFDPDSEIEVVHEDGRRLRVLLREVVS